MSWQKISLFSVLSMLLFVWGQCGLTLRDAGINFTDILIFPPFPLAILLLCTTSFWACFWGIKIKKYAKLCLIGLGLLCLHSIAIGNYKTTLAIREAFFRSYGIGVWLSFLFALPATKPKFWKYFRKHFLTAFKIILFVEVIAIFLLLNGNKGLLRINFSTSVSLFVLTWGLLSSDRSLIFWGTIGLVLFELHSFIHDQRETYLLPLEYAAFFFPLFIFKTTVGKIRKSFFYRMFQLLGLLYIGGVLILIGYFLMPSKYFKILNRSHITKDTRSIVLEDYFRSEMRLPHYYLLGKGVNGVYKSSRSHDRLGKRGYSSQIEIGYLQMVLNVGLLYVICTLIISFFPALKCLIKANNALSLTCALWVLVRTINMTVAAVPYTDFGWFMFWISVGVLISEEIPAQIETTLEKTLKAS